MTPGEADELRKKWGQRLNPIPCKHINLELEWLSSGVPTGKYLCMLCGKLTAIAIPEDKS